jgi:hypothetical protein
LSQRAGTIKAGEIEHVPQGTVFFVEAHAGSVGYAVACRHDQEERGYKRSIRPLWKHDRFASGGVEEVLSPKVITLMTDLHDMKKEHAGCARWSVPLAPSLCVKCILPKYFYSCLSATTGSMCAARRPGTKQAASTAMDSVAAAAQNVAGSPVLTP